MSTSTSSSTRCHSYPPQAQGTKALQNPHKTIAYTPFPLPQCIFSYPSLPSLCSLPHMSMKCCPLWVEQHNLMGWMSWSIGNIANFHCFWWKLTQTLITTRTWLSWCEWTQNRARTRNKKTPKLRRIHLHVPLVCHAPWIATTPRQDIIFFLAEQCELTLAWTVSRPRWWPQKL